MYVEDMIILDVVQASTLLKGTNYILKLKSSKIILLSIVILKVFLTLINLFTCYYLLKLIAVFGFLCVASLLINRENKNVKFGQILLFIAFQYFLQNGAVGFLFNNSKLQLFNMLNPLYLTILSCLIFLLFQNMIFGVSSYLYKKKIIENYTYELEIYYHDKSINLTAFLDTGNALYDKDNNPVILLNTFECEKLFDIDTYSQLILKNFSKLKDKNFFTIDTSTVCGSSSLICFSPDRILVNCKEIKEKVHIALTTSNIRKNVKCGCLLHPKLFSI